MKKAFILILLILICIINNSCQIDKNETVLGYYEMDKTVLKNKNNAFPDYKFLKINKDNTFELRNKKDGITNNFKGIYDYNNEERLITFFYNKKKIFGELKGTIIYFNYPNDFHKGKYQSLLYVKTRD